MNRFVIILSVAVFAVTTTLAAERSFPEIMKAAVAANNGVRKAMTCRARSTSGIDCSNSSGAGRPRRSPL